jgi:nitroreductase
MEVYMNTFEAIEKRRSIRHFLDTPVNPELVLKALDAARMAPSGHNRQPWRFVIVDTRSKKGLVEAFLAGIEHGEDNAALSHHEEYRIDTVRNTCRIIEEAPVNLLVLNTYGNSQRPTHSLYEKLIDMTVQQSLGAAIENFCLAARDLGLGTLWIGHIMAAHKEVCRWLDTSDQLAAAIAVGHPIKWPLIRPRKTMEEIVTWI